MDAPRESGVAVSDVERLAQPYRRPATSAWCEALCVILTLAGAVLLVGTIAGCALMPERDGVTFASGLSGMLGGLLLLAAGAILSAVGVALDEQIRTRRVLVQIASGMAAPVDGTPAPDMELPRILPLL